MQKNIFETKQKMMMAQKSDKTKLFQSFFKINEFFNRRLI